MRCSTARSEFGGKLKKSRGEFFQPFNVDLDCRGEDCIGTVETNLASRSSARAIKTVLASFFLAHTIDVRLLHRFVTSAALF
jgi:hypothetical protein